MNLSATIDTAPLEAKVTELLRIGQNDSIKQVADTYIRELPKLYVRGVGGDGAAMEPYNGDYVRRLGIEPMPKTLKRDKGRLHDLVLDGNTVTVASEYQPWAHGQQTGHSGDWPYSNVMFGANEELQQTAAEELASYITERIAH